jgi:LysM repeat protein
MKIPKFIPRKKLHAATARRSPLGMPDEMDYEMSEPNMKLSRALLIVLVLHVVAVAGIIAFNTIKTHQAPPVQSSATPAPATTPAAKPVESKSESSPSAMTVADSLAAHHEAAKTAPPKAVAVTAEQKADRPKADAKATSSPEAGKIYVVAKGDNPVSIAKKFKISQEALLAINHIDDPKKLKIGQKLLIPPPKPAKPAPKKSE